MPEARETRDAARMPDPPDFSQRREVVLPVQWRVVRAAYLLVYFAMLIVGLSLDMPFWLRCLVGVVAVVPVVVADWLVTKRFRPQVRPPA